MAIYDPVYRPARGPVTLIDVTQMPYGAWGDGTNDDTAAIQRALDEANGPVFFPPGTYKVTGLTLSRSDVRLMGVGGASRLTCDTQDRNTVTISGSRNAVEGLVIDNASPAPSSSAWSNCVAISGDDNVVRQCVLDGFQGGVRISGGDRNLITENLVTTDVRGAGASRSLDRWDIAVHGNGSGNQIVDNRCYGGGRHGIDLTTLTNTDSITDTVIRGNHVKGQTAYGIVLYNNILPAVLRDCLIVNNLVTDISGSRNSPDQRYGAGIYLVSAERCLVSGNVVRRTNTNTAVEMLTPGAIGINACGTCTIVGNTIDDVTWSGIYVADDNNSEDRGGLVIANNQISRTGRDGIKILNYRRRVSITGNVISEVLATYIGIYATNPSFSNARDWVISHNVVRGGTGGNMSAGINIDNVDYLHIEGNEVANVIGTGIGIYNSTQLILMNNRSIDYGTRGILVDASCTPMAITPAGNVASDGRAGNAGGVVIEAT